MTQSLNRAAWFQRLTNHIPPGQFGRYLAVGVCNTVFGYGTYALLTATLARVVPHSYIFASIIAAPLNITFSYLGYKWFVFKTHGNYLREWTRCIVVYGSSMALGVVLLPPVVLLIRWSSGLDRSAPYIGGAVTMGFGVIYSFLGHKNFSFRPRA
ncbi:MAG TPA: GtrA family protein [Terriglobia bacterium]|nr:GtrA family protein [Terriglobia bacterium]